ncbi:hypothetical protein [Chengkuizengella sediminis]|uniref:hypothetical protein n=1 Tax=Chengkuizengella sediminis TaxID=1885917 RepID=UPI001389E65D|nr:hypothetical protein [Chengkuizengella sediminis]NDI34309.1 hypothetical protein [Chengkuizengella sediminis]
MNNKMSILITMFVFVLLGAISIWFWGDMNQKNNITNQENQVESNNNDLLLSWDEINQWKSANNTFTAHSEEPYIIYKNKQTENGVLFVQNGELKFVFETNEEMMMESLLSFDEVTDQMRFWIHNQTVLMGGELKGRYSDGEPKPAWYGISFSDEDGESTVPKVYNISELNYLADQVLTMTYVDEPNLFFMAVDGNYSFREIIYQPGSYKFEYVSEEFNYIREEHYNDMIEQYDNRKPQAQKLPVDFKKVNKYHFTENNTKLFTFEDERGTIVFYKENNSKPYIERYVDFQIEDFKMIFDEGNKGYPLGQFIDPNGKELLILPTEHRSRLHSNSLLWNSNDWKLIRPHYNTFSFYKIDDNELQIIRYKYNWDDTFTDETNSYLIQDAKFIKEMKSFLEFEVEGETKYLSLNDLTKSALPMDEQIDKNHSLWIHDLNIQMDMEPEIEKIKTEEIVVNLPKKIFELKGEGEIPEELSEAEQFECLSGCGDLSIELITKKISNQWYVIGEKKLYKLQGEKIEEIVELPISNSFFVLFQAAAFISTAKDFTRIGDYWIIADTFGNRVIKLNENFNIVSQYELNFPEKISVNDDGSMHIESIEGSTLLDNHLNFISRNLKKFQTFEEVPFVKRNIETNRYYHDLDNDMIWIVENGLYQYKPGTEQYRKFYIGHKYAHHAKTRILPYNNQVIILFDNRAVLFDKNGNWSKTISFPRDNKNYEPVYGESSYHFDEEEGIIYFLQGYKVLQINLETNEVKTIFHQNYNNLGYLLYESNKLYFSVHSSPSENELIVYNLDEGDFKRVKIDPKIYSNQIINESEPKLIFADQFNKSWKSILLEDLK